MRRLIILLFTFLAACNSKQDTNKKLSTNDSTITRDKKNNEADSIIISERIDGPANVRDTVGGKVLFSFNDNIPVTTTDAENKWLQVGVVVDLSKEQMSKLLIAKGSEIIVEGKEIGHTVEDVSLQGAFETEGKLKGELVGYTSMSNLRKNTIPENVFSEIVNSGEQLNVTAFEQFLKDFQFQSFDSLLSGFKAYEIDENWIDDPSPLLRLWIFFRDDKFYGVFHSRHLSLNSTRTYKTKRGFYFSTTGGDEKIDKKLIEAFNSFIVQVD